MSSRNADDLLIHILDPNREVPPIYVNYSVASNDGRVLSGMMVGESGGSLTLKRAEGITEVVLRPQIEAIRSTGQSLMPEGLESGLSMRDLADLIAFIRGLAPVASRPGRPP